MPFSSDPSVGVSVLRDQCMWGASGSHLTGLARAGVGSVSLPVPPGKFLPVFQHQIQVALPLSWLLAPTPTSSQGLVTSLAARLSSPPSLPELIIREAHLRVLFHSSPQRLLWERGHFTSYLLPFTSLL